MADEPEGTTSRYTRLARRWVGTNGFRLMPDDELHEAPATALAVTAASGQDLMLTYTWVHPTDGPQDGVMLAGSPDDGGHLTVAWGDSWHQKPGLLVSLGRPTERGFEVTAEYGGGWKWTISVDGDDERLALTMHNIVPEEYATDSKSAGPYPVMVAVFHPA